MSDSEKSFDCLLNKVGKAWCLGDVDEKQARELIEEIGRNSKYSGKEGSPGEILREVFKNIEDDIKDMKAAVRDMRIDLTTAKEEGVRILLENYFSKTQIPAPYLDFIPKDKKSESDMDNSFWVGIGIATTVSLGILYLFLKEQAVEKQESCLYPETEPDKSDKTPVASFGKHYIAFEQNAGALRNKGGAKAEAHDVVLGSDLHWIGNEDEWDEVNRKTELQKVEMLDDQAQGLHVITFCVESITPPQSSLRLKSFLKNADVVSYVGIYKVPEGTMLSQYGFTE